MKKNNPKQKGLSSKLKEKIAQKQKQLKDNKAKELQEKKEAEERARIEKEIVEKERHEKEAQRLAKEKLIKEGKLLTKKQQEKRKKREAEIEELKSLKLERPTVRTEECTPKKKTYNLRNPVVCVLGHVDSGKTSFLDYLRSSNVLKTEVGGITQKVSSAFLSSEIIASDFLKNNPEIIKILDFSGIIFIDTPGHEAFTAMRESGTALCDFGVIIVSLLEGVQLQTREAITLLRKAKVPFLVLLNKVDKVANLDKLDTKAFKTATNTIVAQFNAENLNAALISTLTDCDLDEYIPLIPFSVYKQIGVEDFFIVFEKFVRSKLIRKLSVSEKSTPLVFFVLETRTDENSGTLIEVILRKAVSKESLFFFTRDFTNRIVLLTAKLITSTFEAVAVFAVSSKALDEATTHELASKTEPGFTKKLNSLVKGFDRKTIFPAGAAVYEASTKGFAAVLAQDHKIPTKQPSFNGSRRKLQISLFAPSNNALDALQLHLKSLPNASSFATISASVTPSIFTKEVKVAAAQGVVALLSFSTKIDSDATALAQQLGVRLIVSDIIYSLGTALEALLEESRQKVLADKELILPLFAVVLPKCLFRVKRPIIVGVRVLGGILRVGTPLLQIGRVADKEAEQLTDKALPKKKVGKFLEIGKVVGIEKDKQTVFSVGKGETAAVKIESNIIAGKAFGEGSLLASDISRKSLDLIKENVLEPELPQNYWILLKQLKDLFGII